MAWRAVALALALGGPACFAAESSSQADPMTDDRVIVKTEGGHQLMLPNDWPVQQKEGHLAAAPIEEYLSMKFGQVRARFAQADGRIDALGRRIAQLEKDQRELLNGLRALEERLKQPEASRGDEPQSGGPTQSPGP